MRSLTMHLPEVCLVSFWQTVTCHPQGLKPLVRVRHTETTHTHTHTHKQTQTDTHRQYLLVPQVSDYLV